VYAGGQLKAAVKEPVGPLWTTIQVKEGEKVVEGQRTLLESTPG